MISLLDSSFLNISLLLGITAYPRPDVDHALRTSTHWDQICKIWRWRSPFSDYIEAMDSPALNRRGGIRADTRCYKALMICCWMFRTTNTESVLDSCGRSRKSAADNQGHNVCREPIKSWLISVLGYALLFETLTFSIAECASNPVNHANFGFPKSLLRYTLYS